ncbi:MAG: outer membrane beta-barrel protein, partial [Pseudomonadota bacterium]
MRSFKSLSLVAAALMASTAMVQAADLIPDPEPELPPEVVTHGVAGGWYIRGDIGYADIEIEDVSFFQGPLLTGSFEQHELDSTWFLQGGIGYQVTDYLRVDATWRYYASSDFDGSSAPAGSVCNGVVPVGTTCEFDDNGELESLNVLMANAYWDLGTYNGFTPYVGAGIGGAHVEYGELFNNQICTPADPTCDANDTIHPGEDQWRFAWAVHAGASYDIDCRWKADAGYTYTRIEGGKMFGSGVSTVTGIAAGGNGFDDGIEIHAGSIGLRYHLDDGACHTPPPPVVY